MEADGIGKGLSGISPYLKTCIALKLFQQETTNINCITTPSAATTSRVEIKGTILVQLCRKISLSHP